VPHDRGELPRGQIHRDPQRRRCGLGSRGAGFGWPAHRTHLADCELADLAADLKSRFSLSLADAFAAALAKQHKAELLTGDPKFKALEKEMKLPF